MATVNQKRTQQAFAADTASKVFIEVGGATLGLVSSLGIAGAAKTRRYVAHSADILPTVAN